MITVRTRTYGKFYDYVSVINDSLSDIFTISMHRSSYDHHYEFCFVDKTITDQLFHIKGVREVIKEVLHDNHILEQINIIRITLECIGDKPISFILDFRSHDKTLEGGAFRMVEGDYKLSDASACSLLDRNIDICYMIVDSDMHICMNYYDPVEIYRRFRINEIINS